ncbi:MAG TPA: HNH endonuclease [Actinomycetota bacterium]|jgi:HNH endonuclease
MPIGSEYETERGYVLVKLPDHPNAQRNGYVGKHIAVMSEMLGRPLRKGESVHHKNLIRNDNRPENLELWVSSQPRGARAKDMAAWCRRFLREYGEAFPEE